MDDKSCPAGKPILPEPVTSVSVQRWKNGVLTDETDVVSEEIPVALIYNNIPYAVMLATPLQLEHFALGFSISEGVITEPAELLGIETGVADQGMEIRMKIPPDRLSRILQRERNLTGRTGCGICGINDLDAIDLRPVSSVNSGNVTLEHAAIPAMVESLREYQQFNRLTGSLHGAAWVNSSFDIQHVCEDVGRHNALDKLIGWLLSSGQDLADGLILVSSRASYEMVQKTVSIGVGTLIALSAPTGMAIRLARQTGLTLVGFASKKHHVVYSAPACSAGQTVERTRPIVT